MTCTIDGCENKHLANGYCNRHYRMHRRGTLGQTQPRRTGQVAIHLDDVEWLAETGETFTVAARRIGVQPDSLHKFLSRHKRLDLFERMRAREREWAVVA